MRIIKVFKLHAIKSNTKRRAFIIGTLPGLTLVNIFLVIYGAAKWLFVGQVPLYKSAAHYWKTSEKYAQDEVSSACDLLLKGWGLRRHVANKIVVTHEDGSCVLLEKDGDRIAERLFYRMMDQVLIEDKGN